MTSGTRKELRDLYAWVYENNQWGRSPQGARYYSDSPPELTEPLRTYITKFISGHRDIETIVDLGCGDYQLASGIEMGHARYLGTDIYSRLVEYNQTNFGDEFHNFAVCDIVVDDLPPGDLCLITMVLYLMSFADVAAVLPKLEQYRYVIITDGQPDINDADRRNIDRPSGKYTPRDLHGNGFYLELEPFSLAMTVVQQYSLPSGEIVRTVLLEYPQ